MKKPKATEQIFSPLGRRVATKFYYDDGTVETRSLDEIKSDAVKRAKEILKKWNEKNEVES